MLEAHEYGILLMHKFRLHQNSNALEDREEGKLIE